jgi:hypothetical protein
MLLKSDLSLQILNRLMMREFAYILKGFIVCSNNLRLTVGRLKVVKIDDVPEHEIAGGLFTGIVKIRNLAGEALGSKDLNIAIVHFPKSVRNVFHSHAHDQVLYILSGKGIVAREGAGYSGSRHSLLHPFWRIPLARGCRRQRLHHISILRHGETRVKEEGRK